MQIKILEIRDKATFIPIMAINVKPRDNVDKYYIYDRCGYNCQNDVVVFNLNSPYRKCAVDPYDWGDRTYKVAHNWIIENWNAIQNGDVIDVEFILGETTKKKISERLGG